MPLDLPPTEALAVPPSVIDALRQAACLSDEARERSVGGQDLDHRARVQLDRMAALLPADSITLPKSDRNGWPAAYTRDDGDLRATLKAMPAGWRIVQYRYEPVSGRGWRWLATLRAPDDSRCVFEARTICNAALRALLAAVAGLLLNQQPPPAD
ncbi:hypothetical protein [Azospirillum sp.]|uniref:hypothetical protein n=1 Tax=Azospirillum sp. TaxID=34012 RepID=UPI003D74A67D